jgi:HSP20 family protein
MAAKETKGLVRAEPARALSPFGDLERRFERMERIFEDFFGRPFGFHPPSLRPWAAAAEEVSPSVDIFEEGNDVVVKAELPGMKKEDLEVNFAHGNLIISGEKKQEEKVEKKDYYRMERSYGAFTRSFRLPAEVQGDKAKATFKDGVLQIRVPKTEEARKKEKKIPIQ